MEKIRYRNFQISDSEMVKNVALESWKYTYNKIYSFQFIQNFIDENYFPSKLAIFIPKIKQKEIFFKVAAINSQIVGFCQIGDRSQGMELCRIYLLPDYIGKGIGKALLTLGEEFIKSKENREYFCYVHEKNQFGRNFYIRNGFIHLPYKDKDDEWYMEKKLQY